MILFFDIDGTIVDEQTQRIPDSAFRAVEELKKNGHTAVVNTGRPYSHVDSRVQAMDFRGFVCACGMELRMDGEWLVRESLSPALRQKIIDVSRSTGMRSFYELSDGGIMADDIETGHPYMSPELNRTRRRGHRVIRTEEDPEAEFTKFVSFIQPGCEPNRFRELLGDEMEIIDRKNGMYELVRKGYSKAEGMRRMLALLGGNWEETFAIGDSANDLPMFAYAAHTICLGGGLDCVKEVSEYVTDSVLNDGIEKALRHYALI